MYKSDAIDKYAKAMCAAQNEMKAAIKGSVNPFFKNKYADLASVWEACGEALHNNGFSVIQSPTFEEGRVGVDTMILHESGQHVHGTLTLAVKKQNDPQADGSAITYARRYALAAMVGVIQTDDDAEGAVRSPSAKEVAPIKIILPTQVMKIEKLLAESGGGITAFLRYAKVKEIKDIKAANYSAIEKTLLRKIAANKEAGSDNPES